MKKIYFILSTIFVLSISQTKAQQTIDSGTGRAQNFFIELGGQGIVLTANYDTRFSNKRNGIGGRAGIGYLAVDGDRLTTIPIGINYLLGKGRSFFEVGIGATYVGASAGNGGVLFDSGDSDSQVLGTMSFSYRLQPIDSGFSFRAGLTPVFNSNNFIPYYAGLSLGYTFSGK
ncbi:MAG: hypothetical protein EOP42_04420 [Sphingobacteriaceae bacterium]|nr:MAG: hypothetical protein EOP42_04420 [Sphingobacteriaceae bacterium]